MNTPRTIRLSPEDNVVVAVDQIAAGAAVAGVAARERVPRGHKMAIMAIREGEPIRKYGQTIGFASKTISPGDWVHEQNVALRDFARDYRFAEGAKNDLREGLGPEFADFEIEDLNPKRFVHKHLLGDLNADEAAQQWTGRFNPRPVTEADLRKLYETAL